MNLSIPSFILTIVNVLKEASTEEAEEVIESVEAEEADIANNDAAGAEEELSLKEKFKQAFNKESVNIKY